MPGLVVGLVLAAVVGLAAGALLMAWVRDRQERADLVMWREKAVALGERLRVRQAPAAELRDLVAVQARELDDLRPVVREHQVLCGATSAHGAIDRARDAELRARVAAWAREVPGPRTRHPGQPRAQQHEQGHEQGHGHVREQGRDRPSGRRGDDRTGT